MDINRVETVKSPYTGAWVKPRLQTYEANGKVYTEAIYVCPSSCNFIKKTIISVEDK